MLSPAVTVFKLRLRTAGSGVGAEVGTGFCLTESQAASTMLSRVMMRVICKLVRRMIEASDRVITESRGWGCKEVEKNEVFVGDLNALGDPD